MHVDTGPARESGERFRARTVPRTAETPPAREPLADGRARRGGGLADAATLCGAGVAREVPAGTQGALLPLIPHLAALSTAVPSRAACGAVSSDIPSGAWPFGSSSDRSRKR